MKLTTCLVLILLSSVKSYSQKIDSTINNIESLPDKYYSKVDKKINSIDRLLTKKSILYLKKSEKAENKLLNKLKKMNPAEADKLTASLKGKYSGLAGSIIS